MGKQQDFLLLHPKESMDITEAEARLKALQATLPPAPRGTYPLYEEGMTILKTLKCIHMDLKTIDISSDGKACDRMDVEVVEGREASNAPKQAAHR